MATISNLFLQILLLTSISISYVRSIDFNYPAVFNFGDSNSDTGDRVASGLEEIDDPYGETYFKKPSGRFCDGRLIVDFLSKDFTVFLCFLCSCLVSSH